MFPPSVDKLIFMDADQIVKEDIRKLYEFDLKGKPYALVPHCNYQETFNKSPFWRDTLEKNNKPYYFSGVYLASLDIFR